MSTEFINDQWRLPNNENKDKQSNYSMDFDGSSQYIDTNYNIPSGNKTISFWFNSSYAGYQSIMGNTSDSFKLGKWSSQFAVPQGISYFQGSTSKAFAITASVTDEFADGNWHHFVYTYDGNSKIYIDGTERTISYKSGTTSSDDIVVISNLSLGLNRTGYPKYSGKLDAVSIFNYALSASQVTTLYGSSSTGIGNPMSLSPKPVAYYPLGDQDAFNGSSYLTPNASLKDFVFDFISNDYIDCGAISQIPSATNLTVSCWLNADSITTNQVVWGDDSSSYIFSFEFAGTANKMYFEYAPGYASIDLNSVITVGTWHHVVMVYDASGSANTDKIKFYIDGVDKSSSMSYVGSIPSSLSSSIGDFLIGFGNAYGNYFNGQLSNVQIFSTSLSSTDIETLYNNGSPLTSMTGFSSLVSWYKLDASDTYDSSTGNFTIEDHAGSNDGTSSGMTQANLVQSDLSFTSGFSPYALEFDAASGDYIDCGQNTNLDTGDLSASMWINKDSTSSGIQYVFNNNDGSSLAGFAFAFNSNNVYIERRTRTYRGYTGWKNIGFSSDVWHHLCITYNDTSKAFVVYLNGVNVHSSTATSSTNGTSQNITIGENSGLSGFNFDGKLSNCSVWNAALTSAQVSELYNEGVPSNLNNHSAYSNLVSWWQLGSNSSFNTNWTVLDEKGSNNGTSSNMGEDAIVDGVGSYANGTSSGMGGDEVVGSAPFSDANSLSINMDVLDRVEDTPS